MWSAQKIAAAFGLTFRQVDHWCRSGYIVAENEGSGTGNYRRFDLEQVGVARRMALLVKAGLSPGVAHLCATGDRDTIKAIDDALSVCRVAAVK